MEGVICIGDAAHTGKRGSNSGSVLKSYCAPHVLSMTGFNDELAFALSEAKG